MESWQGFDTEENKRNFACPNPTLYIVLPASSISLSILSNSRRGGMATHAGVALELGITRPSGHGMKMMSPQMEAILIWCQCRVREYEVRFWLYLCSCR